MPSKYTQVSLLVQVKQTVMEVPIQTWIISMTVILTPKYSTKTIPEHAIH